MKPRKTLREGTGDFSGAGTFHGGPFGFGGRQQLAKPETWNLPEELPPEKRAYQHLPMEDTIRDELLNSPETEPSYFYDGDLLSERGPADILYRDMPGWPAVNTLVNKVDHVPETEEGGGSSTVANLIPGMEDPEPFGVGNLHPEGSLNLGQPARETLEDLSNGGLPDLKLNQQRNQTLNRWKETDQSSRGRDNRDLVSNHLVKPVDWVAREANKDNQLLDPRDTVPLRAGSNGVISHPVKHVPGPVNIYKKGSGAGYSLGESSRAAGTNKAMSKNNQEPADARLPKETYGNGMGQILKPLKNEVDPDRKPIPKREQERREQTYTPGSYDTSTVHAILMEKVLVKLLRKLGKSRAAA